jgi:hypothetical protein
MGTLDGTTLVLTVDGVGPTTLPLVGTGNAASSGALLAAISSQWPTLAPGISSTHLAIADLVSAGTIIVGAGTANGALGLTPGTYVTTLGVFFTGTPGSFAIGVGGVTANILWTVSVTYTLMQE